MNRKGFTLIELMAVVTILAILSLIVIPIVDKNLKKSKDEMYKIQIENIRLAAKGFFSDHTDKKPVNNISCSISLTNLVEYGYISSDIVNPRTGEPFDEYYVQIKNIGTNNRDVYAYYVCPDDDECELSSQSCM